MMTNLIELQRTNNMADLKTTYMGIDLANPVVVGSCSLSKEIDTIKQMQDAGAGAVIIKSLFEEQVQLEQNKYEEDLSAYDNAFSEALTFFPKLEHAGARSHLYWIEETRKNVQIPLIGSLNAVSDDTWITYARQLAETGVDGLELNFYSIPLDAGISSSEIENREIETLARIKETVNIPVSVKIHDHYTSLPALAAALNRHGAGALVLFNRFIEPDIDIDREEEISSLVLSTSAESRHTIRWTALLHGRIEADIVSARGIQNGSDAIKMILAGAKAVQVVSTLYANGISTIGEIITEIENWMDAKGYKALDDCRGKLSKKNVKDPWSYERGQYIKALLGFD
jgi:dihydroorotate dehydrogenase (fumarate)